MKGYDWLRKQFEGEEAAKKIAKGERLTQIAVELGCSMAQLALAWCLKNPHVSTVITGASRAEQVIENTKALEVADQLSETSISKLRISWRTSPKRKKINDK